MKQKTLTIIFGMVFLIGIIAGVGADRIISNIDGIYIQDFIAGSEVQANFSFDYLNIDENVPDSPLIIKIDISCLEETCPLPLGDCSVWKNDFKMNGFIKRYDWFRNILGDLFNKDYRDKIALYCYENSPLTINHPQGPITLEVPDGTFYCYNINYKNLDLDEHDEVFLNILSDPALYPGQYNLTASLYYAVEEEPQPEDQYIYTHITPIVNSVPYGQDSIVEFNITLEIKGGNAIKMKMSNLTNEYGDSYSAEELNATLTYNSVVYNVGKDYEDSEQIVFDSDDEIITETVVFKMDIKSGMKPGNYKGTYRFNVTQNEI